ncbi:cell division protein FtsQ/DivIB [Pelagibacterium limicola]|uniref:cell division protein FtsQ/DivIB n=1 Tax=Pelagibacterium limicola TaxID=2791022 RepID=UPI0018AF56AD|nr:FtsQ-type POTRA domain-containing protein [Pelagibacterium limicola]
MVRLANLWVLHRRMAFRAIILLCLVGAGIAGYMLRDELHEGITIVSHLVTGQVAEAGFGVAQIEITGQALTREADVIRALAIRDFTNTLGLDAEAARLRIEEIPSVETATIRKVYPDSIIVTITEKVPVARWRIDGLTMLIDAKGQPIAPAGFENGELTLVIGEGAGDDALAMITLMNRFPDLNTDLAALSRIADRRWDLIYYTGLRVQLPEHGVVAALEKLNRYNRDHELLARDVDLIDMRIPQYVAVRPTPRDEG